MKNFFTDYYMYKKSERGMMQLLTKYGNYSIFENINPEADFLENMVISKMCLNATKEGRIRLRNPFDGDLFGSCRIRKCNDEIIALLNYNNQTLEFFINDYNKSSNALIIDLATKEELYAEFDKMRLRAFSLS